MRVSSAEKLIYSALPANSDPSPALTDDPPMARSLSGGTSVRRPPRQPGPHRFPAKPAPITTTFPRMRSMAPPP